MNLSFRCNFLHNARGALRFVLFVCTGVVVLAEPVGLFATPTGGGEARDGNAVCAPCHQVIYQRFRRTPMANASGDAKSAYFPGHFDHAASGVHYRVDEEGGRVMLSFARRPAPGASAQQMAAEAMQGSRELKYFIGSGHRGRTYLFEDRGYWFEIPINWYGKKQVWDMAPNFLKAREMPLTLPVDPGCLRCHTTGAAANLPDARNKYAGEPFEAGGIGCTSCHGDARAHVESGGKTAMMKLNELAPVKRDSVCLSCHLEGQAAVVHRGKRLVDFKPGESIFEYASFFVHAGEAGSGGRATSQWEALLQSACKRGSGERLTCTRCHDPHGSDDVMTAGERVAWYRGKCLACHDGAGKPGAGTFARSHHPENQDCTSCHMARASSNDIAHEQVTDHRIVRVAGGRSVSPATTGELVAVGAERGTEANRRDLGLAYAQFGARGERDAAARAVALLEAAKEEPEATKDHELHAQLGFLKQLDGDRKGAAAEYAAALEADPNDSLAAGNLALLEAGSGHYVEAEKLLSRAFEEDPVQVTAGMNLALVECGLGQREAALGTLARVESFSPDSGQAKELAHAIESGERACARH